MISNGNIFNSNEAREKLSPRRPVPPMVPRRIRSHGGAWHAWCKDCAD